MNHEHQRPLSSSAWVVVRHLPGPGLPVVPHALQIQSPHCGSRYTSKHGVPVRACQHPMKVQLEATRTAEVFPTAGRLKGRSEAFVAAEANAGVAAALDARKSTAMRTPDRNGRNMSHLRERVGTGNEPPGGRHADGTADHTSALGTWP